MKATRLFIPAVLLFASMLAGACGAGGRRVSLSSVNAPAEGGRAPGVVVSSRVYSDPDNAFAVGVPDGWRVERSEEDGAYLTVISPEQYRDANFSIMTIRVTPDTSGPAELKSFTLFDSSKPFLQGWMEELKEEARVEITRNIYPTRLGNFDAVGLDVKYYRQDAGDPYRGHCVYLIGDKTIFFIAMTGGRTRFNELKKVISTIRIEP